MTEEQKQNLQAALYKRAVGFTAEDESEEYVIEEGKERLAKRKLTRSTVSPDMSALKMLLETIKEPDASELTEEQLLAERDRLLKLLAEKQERK